MSNTEKKPEDISGSFNFICLDRLIKMNDAKADNNLTAYWARFKMSAQMLMHYMEIEDRQRLNAEFKQLEIYERQWRNNQDLNESIIEDKIKHARLIFGDSREYYLFATLPKTGIIRNIEEGEIDFTKRDIEEIAKIVRGGQGITKGLDDLQKPNNKRD
jgi:hypothetical protein